MNKDVRQTIFIGVGLAMGIATLVLSIMRQLEVRDAISLLSTGLIALAINQLENKKYTD